MALERDFELLDDYLANRLGAEEKASFEKRIEADPELKREFFMQQKLVEGIKQARVAELKGMLSNIPVPPAATGQALLTKLGLVAVVAGLIGTGLYYFLSKEETEVASQPEIAQQEVAPEQKKDAVDQPKDESKANEEVTNSTQADSGKTSTKKDKKESVKSRTNATPAKSTETVSTVKPEAFDPSAGEREDSIRDYNDLLKQSVRTVDSTPSIQPENILDKTHDFHYQYTDGKLKLYGERFRERSMYEILAFFGNKKLTTLVLYQSNKYYLLKEGNEEITKLTPITDAVLLNKLDRVRK